MTNHAYFLGFLGGLNPLKLWVAINIPKSASLGQDTLFKPKMAKSVQGSWGSSRLPAKRLDGKHD